jgi:hypothetical protein
MNELIRLKNLLGTLYSDLNNCHSQYEEDDIEELILLVRQDIESLEAQAQ